jgi:type IV pilus assembly protein PilV
MSSLRLQSKEGFTLIEVMIALVILSVGLLALATMQIVAIRTNAFSTEMTYATMLAQSQFEEFKNTDYVNVISDSDLIPANETSKGIPYTVQWTVQDNTPTTDMKTIDLDVTWTGAPAGSATSEKTVDFKASFTTVIAR